MQTELEESKAAQENIKEFQRMLQNEKNELTTKL